MACELSPSRKKRKKGRIDNPEGIACATANGTSHLTLTGGDGSFLADLKACLICDSGCITLKGLIRNVISRYGF